MAAAEYGALESVQWWLSSRMLAITESVLAASLEVSPRGENLAVVATLLRALAAADKKFTLNTIAAIPNAAKHPERLDCLKLLVSILDVGEVRPRDRIPSKDMDDSDEEQSTNSAESSDSTDTDDD